MSIHSSPSLILISPLLSSVNPINILVVVVLPDPLKPTIPNISSLLMVKETPSTALITPLSIIQVFPAFQE